MIPTAFIDGVGLLGPGLPNWTVGRAVLSGAVAFAPTPTELPPAAALPPAERRRVGRVVKLALAVGQEAAAGRAPGSLVTVFTASGADGDNCHEICQMLATNDRQISPTRFHNSVHNAPAGYWSIANAAMAASTSLCAFDGSFSAGLLEAACAVQVTRAPILMIAYDTDYPEPLYRVRSLPDAFGLALLLSPEPAAGTLGRIEVRLTAAAADIMSDPALEALRVSCPAARGLPLLVALAHRRAGPQVIDYLDHCRLEVALTPWS